jgi:hypothetical protein
MLNINKIQELFKSTKASTGILCMDYRYNK